MIDVPVTPAVPVVAEGWAERLYEVSLSLLCVAGFDGYYKTVNPAWVKTFGYSVEELLAVPSSDFIHPDDLAASSGESAAIITGNGTAHFRNRFRHHDGSYRWLEWLTVIDAPRQLVYASARDITVEKEVEAERIKAQAVLDTVYRSITDHAIYMVDPTGKILSWSLGAESVKGWKAEEVIGKRFDMFYSEEAIAAERPRLDLEDALANGSHRTEGWRRRGDGGTIWTEVTTSPIHGVDRELLGFVNVVHDLSRSRRLQLEMAALNESLETRNKVQREVEAERIKAQAVLDTVYRSITDHAIYMVDPTGVVLSWSLGAESVKGWKAEEVIGKRFDMFYSEEAIAAGRPRLDLEDALVNGSHRTEGWRRRGDGGTIWTEVTTSPIHGVDGELSGFVNVVHDLSESRRLQLEMAALNESLETRNKVQKEVEAERIKAQAVLDTVYRSITDHAIYMVDPTGVVLSWSLGAESVKGWKAEEVIGKRFDMFYSEEAIAAGRPRLDLEDALVNGSHRTEGWRRRGDGGTIWTEVTTSPIHGVDGELSGFVNVVHDLSESRRLQLEMAALNESLETRNKVQKEVEAERIKAQAVLDTVYRSITDHAIYMVDPAGTVLSWSLGAESVKDWKAEEVIGKPFDMFYSAEEIAAARPRRDLEQALANGSHRTEGWRRRQDGGSIWTEVTTSPIYGVEGELLGFVNVVHDLSESHRLQVEMASLNESLEVRIAKRTADLTSAVSELEAFAYTVSHDLRAPLRAMDGFSRILLEEQGPLLSETAQKQLVRVRENAQNMGKLIDGLLRFSRINRGAMERREVDPGHIAKQVADELYAENDQRLPIKIEAMPNCRAEPVLLRQVYANLIGNALKFSRDVKVPEIVIGCDTATTPPTYFVKDNGAGFDMRYAGRLFGVFQRLHRVEDYEGTGIGLATVQRIVHRHGGTIWATAQPNLGATFHFTLEGSDAEI